MDIEESTLPEIGLPTPRMEHNHILQARKGEPGCPACESIDPLNMVGDPRYNRYVLG